MFRLYIRFNILPSRDVDFVNRNRNRNLRGPQDSLSGEYYASRLFRLDAQIHTLYAMCIPANISPSGASSAPWSAIMDINLMKHTSKPSCRMREHINETQININEKGGIEGSKDK